MKKKMSLLVTLLVAVVLTGYSVSGTYAKYTSEFTSTDSARVAQWKLNELTSIDLFKKSYNSEAYAESLTDDKILAPGTSGIYTFNINGIFETDTKITLDILNGTHGLQYAIYTEEQGSHVYDPLQFKLVKVGAAADGSEDTNITNAAGNGWATFGELTTALEAIEYNVIVDKENPANSIVDDTYRIEWKWDFNSIESFQTDIEDTLLGNAIVDALDTANAEAQEDLSVKLNIKLAAEQVK